MTDLNSELSARFDRATSIDPYALVAALYGPTWLRDGALVVSDGGKFLRSRRLPLPGSLAAFLQPILAGIVGHDGRSEKHSRTAGWALRSDSGVWRMADVGAVTDALFEVTSEALERAVDARDDAAAQRAGAAGREGDRSRDAVDAADLRVVLLSALQRVVNADGRAWRTTLQGLRSRLSLPSAARVEIARAWLSEALELGDIEIGRRLYAADLREYAPERDALPLQRLDLYRALDEILGERVRYRDGYAWDVAPDFLDGMENE